MGISVYVKSAAVAILVGAKICGANRLVDWSDWNDQTSSDTNSSLRTVFEVGSAKRGYRGRLYDLVNECAQRLVLRGDACDKKSYRRVPFMESGDLACGFNVSSHSTMNPPSHTARRIFTPRKCHPCILVQISSCPHLISVAGTHSHTAH